jgi:hypothetical protein
VSALPGLLLSLLSLLLLPTPIAEQQHRCVYLEGVLVLFPLQQLLLVQLAASFLA